MTFDTKEDAIYFAEKNGWKYEVSVATTGRAIEMGTYSYSDNFLPRRVSNLNLIHMCGQARFIVICAFVLVS